MSERSSGETRDQDDLNSGVGQMSASCSRKRNRVPGHFSPIEFSRRQVVAQPQGCTLPDRFRSQLARHMQVSQWGIVYPTTPPIISCDG
ncbi:hypothetical protein NA56DRAFT_249861 [Hyaloscypha hepaticicola]|uniref:Uncharacterized protein n=1 Tax=Hyaloscypha hepaticicola TaxID=2082293 RepID=A0A2J6PW93_9HELO|nr:hypothetical protein NA56DRAFT_249861 [Hyaloscypha hepaticicola]